MIDRLVVTALVMVLSLFLAMQLLVFGLSLFRQQQLDVICHKYAMIMDKEGGLGQQTTADLSQELSDSGFSVQSIYATQQGLFGEPMHLQVQVVWPAYRLLADLRFEEVDLSFSCKTEILCRTLIN